MPIGAEGLGGGEELHGVETSPDEIAVLAGAAEYVREGDSVRVRYVGRNEPCLCGSGKKYKHCCIENPLRDPVRVTVTRVIVAAVILFALGAIAVRLFL